VTHRRRSSVSRAKPRRSRDELQVAARRWPLNRSAAHSACSTIRWNTRRTRAVRSPIGSFQAIKHKCADMLLDVESAKSRRTTRLGSQERNDELPIAASLAKSFCSEAYFHCAAENIQIQAVSASRGSTTRISTSSARRVRNYFWATPPITVNSWPSARHLARARHEQLQSVLRCWTSNRDLEREPLASHALIIVHGLPKAMGMGRQAAGLLPELAEHMATESGGSSRPARSPGVGGSTGTFRRRKWRADLKTILERVDEGERRISMAGFGFGGALALATAAEDERIRGVATFATPAHLEPCGAAPKISDERCR